MYAFPSQTQAAHQAARSTPPPNTVPSPSLGSHTNGYHAIASSGRKQACFNCRQRKKKCDAQLPVCSGCMKGGARCTYLPTSVNSNTEQFFQAHASWVSPNNDPLFPLAGSATSMPAVSAQTAEESLMNMSQPLAWDFNFAPNVFPSHYSPVRSNLRSTSSSNTLEQNSGPMGGISSTRQPHSRSEGGSSPEVESNGVSDRFTSATESSVASVSEQTQDIDMRSYQAHQSQGEPMAKNFNTLDLRLQVGRPSGGKEKLHLPGLPALTSVETGKAESPSAMLDDVLPSTPLILELVQTFFSRCHPLLPCIHHQSFLKRLMQGGRSIASDPLVWTILGVAAPVHHVQQIQGLQQVWLARARSLFDKNASQSLSPTQSLQAAVWLAFQAWVSADLTEAWFLVGKACRIANVLRLDRIDSTRPKQLISMAPGPRNAIEIEEQRKVMWWLLYIERSLACLGGFTLGIDERFFQVNYPMDDGTFQTLHNNDLPSPISSETFSRDPNSLFNPIVIQNLGSHPTLDHVFRASVLLGRIMNLHNDLHVNQTDEQFRTEFSQLETCTALFEFTLSRFATGQQSLETEAKDLWLFYWLHGLAQTCTILLYHPLTSSQSPSTSARSSPFQDDGKNDPNFQHCLRAARKFLSVVKSAVNQSVDVLANPFLVTALFLCGRFISIMWHEEQEHSDRDDLDLILLLVDRIGEVWEPLAKKFCKGILRDLMTDRDEAKRMRVGTGCYLSVECA